MEPPLPMTRRCWCHLMLGGMVGALLSSNAAADPPPKTPGGALVWARLKTTSPTWNRHARSDPRLLEFMRTNTSLDIDPRWHSADVEDLDRICAYPFLFSEGIHYVTDAPGQSNLREYIQRGGFLFIDSCINTHINPDPDLFLQLQVEMLKTLMPDADVREVDAKDPIYHICFPMKDGLPHTYMHNIYNPDWARHGLNAVYSQNRLVSIISLSGLQCGWASMNPSYEHILNCMKMMVNIYAYAVTH